MNDPVLAFHSTRNRGECPHFRDPQRSPHACYLWEWVNLETISRPHRKPNHESSSALFN